MVTSLGKENLSIYLDINLLGETICKIGGMARDGLDYLFIALKLVSLFIAGSGKVALMNPLESAEVGVKFCSA